MAWFGIRPYYWIQVNLLERVMSLINLLKFKIIGDERGSLIALEGSKNIPFEVRRVYYIFDTKTDVARGFHAHQDLQQIAVCVKGSCRFVLDDGKKKEEVILKKPDAGLFIRGLIWREMYDFSDDCVLLILASEVYTEEDYIRNYKDFKRIANEQ